MDVECIPLTEFVHGNIVAHEGRPLMIAEHLARELEKAALVRIKMAPPPGYLPAVQAAADFDGAGKVQDGGAGRPSSASPADPASHRETLHLSRPGETKPRKSGA